MTQSRVGWRSGNPVSISYLLDTYSGAAVAYSLRKLKSDYTGPAIRVRRSNDSTSQDIGFDTNGNLDTTSILSFVAAPNSVLYSEDFGNSWWHKNDSSVVINSTTAPNGTMTGNLFKEGTSNWNHSLGKLTATTYAIGTSYNCSVYLKKGSGSLAPDTIALGFGEVNSSTQPYVIFNITTGTVVTSGNATNDSDFGYSITNEGNGWWRCSIFGTVTISQSRTIIPYVRFVNNQNTLPGQYLGNVNRDIFVWGYQFVSKLNDTSYLTIKPYNKTAVTAAGDAFVSIWYDQSSTYNATQIASSKQPQIVSAGSVLTLNSKPTIKFDGTDDFLVTGTYSFVGTDKIYTAHVSSTNVNNIFQMVFGHYKQFSTAIYMTAYRSTGRSSFVTRNSANTGAFTYDFGTYSINTQYLYEQQTDLLNATSTLKVKSYRNNIQETMNTNGGTTTILPTYNEPLSIGADEIGTNFKLNGNIQEIVAYYNADQSTNRTGIASNINSYYSIY